MPWSTPFDDPVRLPNGRHLLILKDAAEYITKLLAAEHSTPEWQAAMESLILFAEKSGPTMLACIGVVRALNRFTRAEACLAGASRKTGKRT